MTLYDTPSLKCGDLSADLFLPLCRIFLINSQEGQNSW